MHHSNLMTLQYKILIAHRSDKLSAFHDCKHLSLVHRQQEITFVRIDILA